MRRRFTLRRVALGFLVFTFASLMGYAYLFGPVDRTARTQEFLVAPGQSVADVAQKLEDEGFIRTPFAFHAAYRGGNKVRPGGYRISRAMDALAIADTLARTPSIAWITVTPGMRKEEIANLLALHLTWTDEEKEEWLTKHTAPSPSFIEGVYFPDTYLIPTDYSPKQVAERMRTRFQEVFAPYANEAAEKGMTWTEVVNLASLVEREAARNDKALVAAILWNRIDRGMRLQVDATLQYIRGSEERWWPVPRSEDKFLESPFNTYMNAGLPPHPIANPSLDSIRAVINPDRTDCIYYLHDNNGQIHCSTSYAQHKAYVDTYLR